MFYVYTSMMCEVVLWVDFGEVAPAAHDRVHLHAVYVSYLVLLEA